MVSLTWPLLPLSEKWEELLGGVDCGFANHVAAYPELLSLAGELVSHLFDAANQQEWCLGEIVGCRTGQSLRQFGQHFGTLVRNSDDLYQCFDLRRGTQPPALGPHHVQHGVEMGAGPPHVVPVPVGKGAAKSGKRYHVSASGGCLEDPSMPAADH
ncbi:hypothetical protein SAMN05444365_104344 [Micromonospora pattaloongensis]|uniref:Uncharacterized protein n=1 Tax=Micromonospora pattaloongensis TaxID=405436 RepID=A0A1H3P641_9ACTN|nr:hypothetical protein SAMN05444365_104344 [Micromonospora pattaloongensis]